MRNPTLTYPQDDVALLIQYLCRSFVMSLFRSVALLNGSHWEYLVAYMWRPIIVYQASRKGNINKTRINSSTNGSNNGKMVVTVHSFTYRCQRPLMPVSVVSCPVRHY